VVEHSGCQDKGCTDVPSRWNAMAYLAMQIHQQLHRWLHRGAGEYKALIGKVKKRSQVFPVAILTTLRASHRRSLHDAKWDSNDRESSRDTAGFKATTAIASCKEGRFHEVTLCACPKPGK
jgi:hypothetical protein